jgi:hypothetical protein
MSVSCALLIFHFLFASNLQELSVRRVLYIFGNDLHQQQVDKQLSLFREKESACRERDLDVLHVYLLPERAKLYKRYNIPFGEYRVVFVGKDRGAKLISHDLVNPRQIFDLIDSMPMRQ